MFTGMSQDAQAIFNALEYAKYILIDKNKYPDYPEGTPPTEGEILTNFTDDIREFKLPIKLTDEEKQVIFDILLTRKNRVYPNTLLVTPETFHDLITDQEMRSKVWQALTDKNRKYPYINKNMLTQDFNGDQEKFDLGTDIPAEIQTLVFNTLAGIRERSVDYFSGLSFKHEFLIPLNPVHFIKYIEDTPLSVQYVEVPKQKIKKAKKRITK